MSKINKKQLLTDLAKIEATANMLARQCNELRQKLDDTIQTTLTKKRLKKADEPLMNRIESEIHGSGIFFK